MTNQMTLDHQFVQLYQTAQTGAVWVNLNAHGRLVATDRDRLDLLHRLSTNNLNALPVGQLMRTVFTTAQARIIDQVTVLNRGEEAWIITGENRHDAVRNWLQRNVFFNDKFKQQDVTDALQQIGIYGAQATTILSKKWPEVENLTENQHIMVQDGAGELVLARVQSIAGAGYWVFGEADAMTRFQKWSGEQGTTEVPDEVYDALRISEGLARTSSELTQDYIPLEVGLWDAVSFKKGCYIGQEIIARMESRGKLANQLVQVELTAWAEVGTVLQNAEGKNSGTLTSVAQIPSGADTKVLGLAVVKSAYAEPNQRLVLNVNDMEIHVNVLKLVGTYEVSG